MNREKKYTVGHKAQEDMTELFNQFKIPKLKYIDIAQQERLDKIIAHWPLLEELKGNSLEAQDNK